MREDLPKLGWLHHYQRTLGNSLYVLLFRNMRVRLSGKEQEWGLIHVWIHCARHLKLPLKCFCDDLYGLIQL